MFEKVVGYDAEKSELIKFCDIISNSDYYKQFGVEIPKGIILHGEAGVGKTTFANEIINSTGRPYFIIRKDAGTDEFIKQLRDTFEEAKKKAPSIVLLDDMDKFGDGSPFSAEYTSLQGIIDNYRQYDIFVIGTANEIYKMPKSLIRPGRFDRVIDIDVPTKNDAVDITRYYLQNKNIDPSVDINIVSNLLDGHSCATLESVINMAAMYAVYDRSNTIKMNHITDAVLSIVYDMPKRSTNLSREELYKKAIHEAGHVVVADYIYPGGVTIVTLRQPKNVWEDTTYFDRYKETSIENAMNSAIIALGGKAAIEIRFNTIDLDRNTVSEVQTAISQVTNILNNMNEFKSPSIDINEFEFEDVVAADKKTRENSSDTTTKCYNNAKNILYNNWTLVEAIAKELLEHETLTGTDIAIIKNNIYNPYFAGLVVSQ